MKRRISETYHFERNESRDGFIHGQFKDAIGILGGPESIAGDDQRVYASLNALHEGFTIEQFLVATLAIMSAFEQRAIRHTEQLERARRQADFSPGPSFSLAVLEQTSVARRKFQEALTAAMEALGEATSQRRDGFEKYRAESNG